MNVLDASQLHEGDVFVPVGIFGDQELGQKWNDALNHCGDQSMLDLACHNICDLKYSAEQFYLYDCASEAEWANGNQPKRHLFLKLPNSIVQLSIDKVNFTYSTFLGASE